MPKEISNYNPIKQLVQPCMQCGEVTTCNRGLCHKCYTNYSTGRRRIYRVGKREDNEKLLIMRYAEEARIPHNRPFLEFLRKIPLYVYKYMYKGSSMYVFPVMHYYYGLINVQHYTPKDEIITTEIIENIPLWKYMEIYGKSFQDYLIHVGYTIPSRAEIITELIKIIAGSIKIPILGIRCVEIFEKYKIDYENVDPKEMSVAYVYWYCENVSKIDTHKLLNHIRFPSTIGELVKKLHNDLVKI